MSTFIVSDKHISALISAAYVFNMSLPTDLGQGLTWVNVREANQDTRNLIGATLLGTNYESVNANYGEDMSKSDINEIVRTYKFSFYGQLADYAPSALAAILKALDCYEYQCSEAPGYHQSLSFYAINALRGETTRRLPGYDKAMWEITD